MTDSHHPETTTPLRAANRAMNAYHADNPRDDAGDLHQTTASLLTVAQWRERENGEEATPACPHCGRRLGIRLGVWRDNGRDAWLCDHDGEFEAV